MALQRIETDGIEDDAITTVKIAPNAVAAADIAADAITNVKVAAGAAIAVAKISGLGTAATLTAGTAANNVVQLDGSGNMPAVNGSGITNLTSANLSGALPAISGANLTGVSTDTSAMENNIAILAFKTQSANNLAKFNLVDQVIDEYKDDTGLQTQTTIDRVGSTATDGYMASIYDAPSVTTPSSSSDFAGNTSGNTFSSGRVYFAGGGDESVRSAVALTGDFEFEATLTEGVTAGGWVAVFLASEVGTFNGGQEEGDLDTFNNSYFYATLPRAGQTAGFTARTGGNEVVTGYSSTNGQVIKIKRVGSTITNYLDGVLKYTATGVNTGTMHTFFGGGGASGSVDSDYTSVTWTTYTSATNATGTLISTANTALTAPTTGDICMLIENASGTATLNTDLKAYISRNGGTGWDQVTLVDKGSWGTNKKILTANNVAFSNSASGTDMRYKIEWANQASGSKETRVHATSLAWA